MVSESRPWEEARSVCRGKRSQLLTLELHAFGVRSHPDLNATEVAYEIIQGIYREVLEAGETGRLLITYCVKRYVKLWVIRSDTRTQCGQQTIANYKHTMYIDFVTTYYFVYPTQSQVRKIGLNTVYVNPGCSNYFARGPN